MGWGEPHRPRVPVSPPGTVQRLAEQQAAETRAPDTPDVRSTPPTGASMRARDDDARARDERHVRQLFDALEAVLVAGERHDLWCGHNPDAPGDPSHHAFASGQAVLDRIRMERARA